MSERCYSVEFYEDAGSVPVRTWLRKLSEHKRRAAVAAVELVLARFGPAVCRTEHGKALGHGLFELRIRHSEAGIERLYTARRGAVARPREAVLLRVYFAVLGDRRIVLLGAYDKGKHPSRRHESRQIDLARRRLRTLTMYGV